MVAIKMGAKAPSTSALALALLAAVAIPGASFAAEVEVHMKNHGAGGAYNVFDPAFVHIAPGDTVHFVPSSPGHNVVSIDGILPAGADPLKSAPGQDYRVTLTREGVYGYRCAPHYGLGMVGVIVVGKASNVKEAEAVSVSSPRAQANITALLKQAETFAR
jgi:pseudoazurin